MTDMDDVVIHYGVKGMKWGVRRDRVRAAARKRTQSYGERAYRQSPGKAKTVATTRDGHKISIEKDRPSGLAMAIARATGRKPADNLSAMTIRNQDGKKVGSFQMWREGDSTVRGEWLNIDKEHQGKGYSETALKALIAGAKGDKKIDQVRLQVPSDAAAAKHIYGKLGFEFDFNYGNVEDLGNIEDWVLYLNR